jgi:hypothetical protein
LVTAEPASSLPGPDAGVLGDQHPTVINKKLTSPVGPPSTTTTDLAPTFSD